MQAKKNHQKCRAPHRTMELLRDFISPSTTLSTESAFCWKFATLIDLFAVFAWSFRCYFSVPFRLFTSFVVASNCNNACASAVVLSLSVSQPITSLSYSTMLRRAIQTTRPIDLLTAHFFFFIVPCVFVVVVVVCIYLCFR